MHADELVIDVELVRGLLARSTPEFAGLPVTPVATTGSSNALFRLGSDLVARLPRQPGGSASIEKEARWAPYIADHIDVVVPEVVALGSPGLGYPERWSVTRWIDGEHPPVPGVAAQSRPLAADLARLIAQLRAMPVPAEALADPALAWYRGGPLAEFDDDVRAAVAQCGLVPGLDLDLPRALDVWESAVAAERGTRLLRTWYHGDLLAENLLVRGGRLAAVLDLGGLGIGDPAVDLVVAWEVLDRDGRAALRAALDVEDTTWARARGWAVGIALITFPYYWDSLPDRCRARRTVLGEVLADTDP